MKACAECGVDKPMSEFYVDRFGYSEKKCKPCRLSRKHRLAGSRTVSEKKCTDCQTVKPVTEFNNDCKSTDGKQARCKPCRKMDRVRRKYGLTREQYDLMLWSQDNQCVTCTSEFSSSISPVVDHCHKTGKVRGLLCSNCNTALGLFNDNVDTMQRAREYVARSACKPLFEEVI